MKLLKNNWPDVLMAAACIFTIVDISLGITGLDYMNKSIMYFSVVIPLCSFIMALWYGFRLERVRKWLIIPACGICEILTAAIILGDPDVSNYWWFGLYSVITSNLGMVIGSIIRNIKIQSGKNVKGETGGNNEGGSNKGNRRRRNNRRK